MYNQEENNFMAISDDRTMLLESYVRFRNMYITMLSLESWGDACPSAARKTIDDMRELLADTFQYLGNSAINEYLIRKRDEARRLNRSLEEQEKAAAMSYMAAHPEEQKGGAQ